MQTFPLFAIGNHYFEVSNLAGGLSMIRHEIEAAEQVIQQLDD